MRRKTKYNRTSLNVCNTYEGEMIEEKVNRILNNKEPIKDGAPIIFTERRDGVDPAHNIRTDRFELAVDAMDKVNRSKLAKREDRLKGEDLAKDDLKKKAAEGQKGEKKDGGPEPTQATGK